MSDLPRDTPPESPAVLAAVELPADPAPGAALARLGDVESLEHGFTVWAELREAYRFAQRRWAEERRALSDQGELLLGAVRAAAQEPVASADSSALALDGFLGDAQRKLEAAKAALDAQISRADEEFRAALAAIQADVRGRVVRAREAVKPVFRVSVRHVGSERRILHARRLGPDEAVIALSVLADRLPSRYDYLFDDSTDDLAADPPTLYAEEGIAPGEVRTSGVALQGRLSGLDAVWPVKGMLPMPTPIGLARWLQRGPIMEAEVADGAGFRNVLTKEEAERLTGHLLALKLAGKVELELARD
jgi:hypothetical protein